MTALPSTVRPRVAQLVRLFASPHDGEALGACRAVGRVLTASGVSFADLAEVIERVPEPVVIYREQPEPMPHVAPAWCNSSRLAVRLTLQKAITGDALTAWEREFAASIIAQMAASSVWRPSAKQEARIDVLLVKLHAAGVWA